MNHTSLLSMMLPPVSYNGVSKNISADLIAEGTLLDAVELAANHVTNAITPYLSGSMLVDWERVLGLPVQTSKNYQERVERVIAKLAETGGLSIPYYIKIAKSLGYKISITELEPFYADYSKVDDCIYEQDAMWAWQVVIYDSRPQKFYPFRASSSSAEDSLLTFGQLIIETVFNELKPAHTFAFFVYT